MAATARGNDSGASGQATTTRAQPRRRLEAESDTRRSWRITRIGSYDDEIEVMTEVSVDRRAWTGALMVERSQIEHGQSEEEEVGAHLLAGLQRSMTVGTGLRSGRRELAIGLVEQPQIGRCGEGDPSVGATRWYKGR
ncbi:LOW QUALITY PROTEIN: hypothetical protein Bca4012_031011 [Brassica carinata]